MPRYYGRRYKARPKRVCRKPVCIARRALRVARAAKKIGTSELKYKDNVVAGPTAITQNPAASRYWDVNCPVLGAEVYKRIGNQIYNRSFAGTVDLNVNSAGGNVQRVHIMIVHYPQSRNSAIDMNELFTNDDVFEPLRHIEYAKSFKVLYSKTFTLDKDLRRIIHVKWYKRLAFKTRFSAANGDYTDVSQGLIQMFMWSDSAANQPTYSDLSTRLLFNDS